MVNFDEHLRARFTQAMPGEPETSLITFPFVGWPATPALEVETPHGGRRKIRMATPAEFRRADNYFSQMIDAASAKNALNREANWSTRNRCT
jgi:hypothetical protein